MIPARRRLAGTPEPTQYWRGGGGVRLAGDVWGAPGGRLVVLAHGGGQTRHAWKHTGTVLAELGYLVVAFDARGHGDSDWAPDADYTQDAMVDDLVELVDQVGGSRPVLVGASMGGGTSLVAAGEGRVDAGGVVLVDIAARIEPEGAAKIGAFMDRHPDGFATLDEVADAIGAYQPHRTRPASLDGLAKNVRVGADGRFYWHWDPQIRIRRPDLARRQQRLEDAARALTVPTLLVRGGLSDVLTERGAREFVALCPHADSVSVDGAAHMVAGDRNDAFGEAMIEFLTRHVPAGIELDETSTRPGARPERELRSPPIVDVP